MRMSSGAIHRGEPPGLRAEDSVQPRLAMDDRPKSVRQAQPEPLIKMLALSSQQEKSGSRLVRCTVLCDLDVPP